MRISYRNFARVGWRARIGVIAPGTGLAGIADFHKIAPEGVAMCATILPAHLTQDTVEQITRVGDSVADAAKVFIYAKLDVILWNCTTGSLMGGYGYDQELIKRIEDATNITATTTSTAMMAAFRKLGIRKVCLAMPYIDE